MLKNIEAVICFILFSFQICFIIFSQFSIVSVAAICRSYGSYIIQPSGFHKIKFEIKFKKCYFQA